MLTGWFSEFGALEQGGSRQRVEYGDGAARFAGATYDPTSHYRGAAVFSFHEGQGLTPDRLREISRRQVEMLMRAFETFDVDARAASVVPIPDDRRAGFLAIRTDRARELSHALRARDVFTDYRGDILRLGPAPYVSDQQLVDAVEGLKEVLALT